MPEPNITIPLQKYEDLIAANATLKYDLKLEKQKLAQQAEANEMMDVLSQFRRLMEEYEIQFGGLAPESFNPLMVGQNYLKEFQNRQLRWQWILTECKDERAKYLASRLQTASSSKTNFIEVFSTFMAVILFALPRRVILFSGTRKKFCPDRVIASMKWFGILDEYPLWTQDVVTMMYIIKDMTCLPSPIAEAVEQLKLKYVGAASSTSPADGGSESKHFKPS